MYRMYYTGYDGSHYRIGLALSKDGIHFEKYYDNPILNLGPGGSWDDYHVSHPYVVYTNNQWRLYYGGFTGAHWYIGLALSKDGIHFEKYHDNPILNLGSSGSWDDVNVNFPCVIYIDNQWYLYYIGRDGGHTRMGLALSKDGIHFEKYHDNPILDLGPNGTWDDYYINHPYVVRINDQYYVYYSAFDGSNYRIGVAFSKDGIHFEKYHDNPILNLGPGGTWDHVHIRFPSVIYINNQLWIYYTGHSGIHYSIGVALSKDGINFEKYYDNPILDIGPSGSWDNTHVESPCVIKV